MTMRSIFVKFLNSLSESPANFMVAELQYNTINRVVCARSYTRSVTKVLSSVHHIFTGRLSWQPAGIKFTQCVSQLYSIVK